MMNGVIKVKRWRANVSSHIILFILALILFGIAYLLEFSLTKIIFGLLGVIILSLAIRTVYLVHKRTKTVQALKVNGERANGVIVGFKSKRRYDADMSLTALLSSSSGISFSKYTIFIVHAASGEVYESDPTNVPEANAENFVTQKTHVEVLTRADESYVDIETIPDFHFKLF